MQKCGNCLPMPVLQTCMLCSIAILKEIDAKNGPEDDIDVVVDFQDENIGEITLAYSEIELVSGRGFEVSMSRDRHKLYPSYSNVCV